MYLKEKQYKIAMIHLCPVQGPWASSYNIWLESCKNQVKFLDNYEVDFFLPSAGLNVLFTRNRPFSKHGLWHF